jgi:EmrB/QacA subfamily drug resistance transporter
MTSLGHRYVRYWWDAISQALCQEFGVTGVTGVTGGRRRWSAAAVAVVAFLTTTDGTIVNVALPSIQRDLRLSLPTAQWVVTGYLITFSAFMLTGGRLSDRYGRRLVLQLGLGVFTAASLLAGVADSAAVLLIARAVQGAGAALALPACLAVVASGPTARDRDATAAVWMASLASALAMGPFLGGWISQHLRWNWIFLVNVPAGLAGLLIAGLAVEDSPRDETAHTDWAGLVCSAAVLAAATFVLIDGAAAGWTSPLILLAGAASAVGAAGFCYWERRCRTPMIDLALLSDRVLRGGVAASVMWGAGVNGVFFFTSLFLQRYAGFSATRTGLVFVPVALLVILVTPLTPAIAERLGAARTVATGLIIVAAGLALLAVTVGSASPQHLSIAVLLAPAAVIGAGSALTVPLTTSVLASVPAARAGVAGGILSLAREASGLVGIGVIGLIVTASGSVPSSRAVGTAFARGYERGLLTAAALTLVGALVAWRALPGQRPASGQNRGTEEPPLRSRAESRR